MDANRRLPHGRGELASEEGGVIGEDGPGGDDARVFETEERLGDEVGGPGTIRELRPSGGASKARVVASEESREEGVRRVRGGDAGETQFGHEAILQRAEDPLDTALRLGTGGGDPADPQFLQEASHLSGCPRPLKLLVEAPAAISPSVENTMPIPVRRPTV